MTRTWQRTMKAAAGAGIAGLIVTAALWGSSATTAQAKDEGVDDQTFTIGLTNEVDSFNPFNGIEAESYEAWALMYDYMISWSDKDMSPQPGLATSWDTSPDGLTWTFHIRDGREVVRRRAADRQRHRLHLQPDPRRRPRGSVLGLLPQLGRHDHRPRRHTVVMTLSKPNAVLPLLPMPILPEHVWKDVSEDDVKTYSNEPESEDQPVVGSGPFKLIEGKAGGSTYRFVRNDDYWGGTPKMAEVDMQVYRSEDTQIQALKAGEIDFAEDIDALQVKALAGRDRHHRDRGRLARLRRDRLQHRFRRPQDRQADGRPQPGCAGPEVPLRAQLRDRPTDRSSTRPTRAPDAGREHHPAGLHDLPLGSRRARRLRLRPRKGEAAARRGRLHGRRRRHGAPMPDGSPIGQLRLYARSDSETSINVMAFFQEWLKDVQIDSKVTTSRAAS